MNAYHCEQQMRTDRIPLISGRIQVDHLCTACGYQEREIRNAAGKMLLWRNLTLHKTLARSETTGV